MRKMISLTSAVFLLAAGLSKTLPAQQTSTESSAAGPGTVEPEATKALKEMGTYLRSLRAFQVRTEGTTEVVLTDGQKVQLSQNTNLLARLPDRLMAEIDGDRGAKVYFFDGKTFTLFARDKGYYATVAAPSTLLELANALEDKYDLEMPLADLFMWGHPSVTPPTITSAIDIGRGEIEGVSCEHFAFRQEGLDWQVWIQKGDYPLPRKLVLTTTTDEARPQHTIVLTWNLAPSYNEAAFAFDPPPDAHKIVFADAYTGANKTSSEKKGAQP